MKEAVTVKDVITQFGDNRVHDGISFHVRFGEIFGILGGSGSGKSTILRQLILLQENQGGEITVLGKKINGISEQDAKTLRLQWGVLFQFGALYSSLNVLENIGITLKEYTNLPKNLIDEIAISKIKMVGLPTRSAKLYPSELSGGMKKRAGLARALAMDPKILFLDEPTSGLDPSSAEAFDRLIVELKHMLNLTVVMVTHDLGTIRNALDRFAMLYNKKVLLEGTMEDVRNSNQYILKDFFKI